MGRLNKKAGVKATIVLDRTSGAILKTSGQISAIRTSKNPASSSALPGQAPGSFSGESNPQGSESQAVEELASLVWTFVNTAGSLVQDLDTEVRFTLREGSENISSETDDSSFFLVG